MLHDGGPGQGFVAFLLEKDCDHVVPRAASRGPGPIPCGPPWTGARTAARQPGLRRRRTPAAVVGRMCFQLRRIPPGCSSGAGVAVAAGLRQVLAEVTEQELPPAAVCLGVAAHHGEAGLVHPLPGFGPFDGALYQSGQLGLGGEPDAPLAGGDSPGLLQLVHQPGESPGREPRELGQRGLGGGSKESGMSAWITKRTLGLSIPMPNAVVATTTFSRSSKNCSWMRSRSAAERPA